MSNPYYMIWADAILSFKKHNPALSDWQIILLVFITWMQALNAWIIFLWLKYFNIFQIPLININIFPGQILDEFIHFLLNLLCRSEF
jgi:hypothetical protein